MRLLIRGAGLALLGLGSLPGGADAPLRPEAAAEAAPRPQQIGGTWDLSWKSRRGNDRKGIMVIEQRGSQLVARIQGQGIAATGYITGSTFTLQASRLALPYTVTGRVSGRKMTGMLQGLGVERRFTGVRRRGR